MSRRGLRKPNEVTTCGDTVVVHLTKGQSALVDLCDYPLVSGHRWVATAADGVWYAKATVRSPDDRRVSLFMHRAILGLGSGDTLAVDHIDGNGLNNSRANLRLATTSQNAMNRRKRASAHSRHKGISLHPSGLWKASICCRGKIVRLGYFRDEQEAALAYNRAAMELFGEFACLNEVGVVPSTD